MSREHEQSLWYQLGIAQVVKQPNGDPGRKDPLAKKQGQGEHRIAVITNDMPDTIMNPTYCFTNDEWKGPYGPRTTSYRDLDGSRFLVEYLGPNRDCYRKSVLAPHTGPETQGTGGATGDPTVMPTVKKQGQ